MNNKGIVSLVFGVLSIATSFLAVGFILGIVGLIFGVIGLGQINRYRQSGKLEALGGIICCLFGIFLTIKSSISIMLLLS
ncbi:DUF4190 domain-containing protein [Ureibacillus acetophenoni]|uniref:Uncharacterized protein DUF4190 n=1 Tax=Ureibacillus acetophenoni TaxID=614649 RepID=A0A285UHX4_9BACL|nr:DUF4190 domain-containing protein [Ureibacillus acetophenoni]SOC41514.1 uncharacterized protein DUF4190 [Ureibacillus acetophenoni]